MGEGHEEVANILLAHPSLKDVCAPPEEAATASKDELQLRWVPQRGAAFAELRFHEIRTAAGAGIPQRSRSASRKVRATLQRKSAVLQGRVLLPPQQQTVNITRKGIEAIGRCRFDNQL